MMNTRCFLLTMGAVFALAGCARPRVAVNPRADFTSLRRVAVATFGGPGGDVAADYFTHDLLSHGADIVERQRLDAVLREHRLAAENILDPETVVKVGKILGVDAIFVGTVASYVPSQSYVFTAQPGGINLNTVTPVSGATLYPSGSAMGIPDSQVVTSAARVSLLARLVDVETGSILWAASMSYEGLDSQSTLGSITSSFAESLIPLWPALHK